MELEALGFTHVASMRGGMTEWNRMRFPTTRTPLRVPGRSLTIAFATSLDPEEKLALATAAALAVASGARLVLVHATTGSEASHELPDPQELARTWGRALSADSVVHTCCEDVTDTLLDALRRLEPDLVVCGTHQHGGLSQLLTGSVAEAVARNVRVPTLVVPLEGRGLADPATGVLTLARVVVPTGDRDAARTALAAVEWLVTAARLPRPELVLLAVDDGSSTLALDDLPAGVRVSHRSIHGSLEATIESAADELEASMLVMATRGHDGIADALRGSHTERVLRAVSQPMLVVPMLEAQAQKAV
jgi:nucleotide-binding universal stress UspA family protein